MLDGASIGGAWCWVVTVIDKGWDTHQQIGKNLLQMDSFRAAASALDRAYSQLIHDLHERGLLDSTLVMLSLASTPKLNDRGGRDHWPRAGFACLAGGGVRGGQIIGATDRRGETPDLPVSPEDLAWTTLNLLGIDPAQTVHSWWSTRSMGPQRSNNSRVDVNRTPVSIAVGVLSLFFQASGAGPIQKILWHPVDQTLVWHDHRQIRHRQAQRMLPARGLLKLP